VLCSTLIPPPPSSYRPPLTTRSPSLHTKVAVYKAVRAIADIPVNLVKEWTTTLPKTLLEGCSKEDADKALKQLVDAGAKGKVN